MMSTKEPGIVTPGKNPLNIAFDVGIDWLDFTIESLDGASQAQAIISQLEVLLSDVIDFSPTKAVFNGKEWDGSGRGESGVLLWYDAPTADDTLLVLDEHGQYRGFEHLLPARNVVIEMDAVDYCRANLPEGVELFNTCKNYIGEFDHGYRLRSTAATEGNARLKVAMSSQVLARCHQQELLEWLAAYPAIKFSRVDIALDDCLRSVPMRTIRSAVVQGSFFDAKYRCLITSGNVGEDWGETIYLGSPSSDKRLRIYDKRVESKGANNSIRWELELRRERAQDVCVNLISLADSEPGKLCPAMIDYVLGAVDFRDRGDGQEKNRARCKRLPWFQGLIDALNASPVKIRVRQVKQTVQRAIDWIDRSVAPSIALLAKILDEDFPAYLSNIVVSGSVKMNNIKRRLSETTDKQQLCF